MVKLRNEKKKDRNKERERIINEINEERRKYREIHHK